MRTYLCRDMAESASEEESGPTAQSLCCPG